jgi:hypothetical protein
MSELMLATGAEDHISEIRRAGTCILQATQLQDEHVQKTVTVGGWKLLTN